jgi:YVTN family beta-propeller protein
LVLANNTLVPGNFQAQSAGDPTALVADSGRGEFLVADSRLDAVQVVSIATGSIMANISVGAGPSALALVEPTGQLWVANALSANLSVISLSNNSVAATLAVGSDPDGLVYDSGTGDVFVANGGSNNLTVVNGTTDAFVTSIAGFQDPAGMVYVAAQGEIFVADSGSHNVTVVRDSDDQVTSVVAVDGSPAALALDPTLDEVFAPSSETLHEYSGPNLTSYANVSVISASNGSVATTFGLNYGSGALAFDNRTDEVDLDELQSDEVAIVDPATDRVVANVSVGIYPDGAAVDPGTGDVFVLNEISNDVTVLVNTTPTETIGLGMSPLGSAYDNETGKLFIADPDGNEVLVISTVTNEIIATVPVGDYPMAVTFDNRSGDIFVSDALSNQVSVLSGATASLVATVPVGSEPMGLATDPAQGLVFVANYLSSNVTVISSANDQVLRTIPVGAEPDSLVFDPGTDQVYVAEAQGWGSSLPGLFGGVAEISALTEAVDGNVSGTVFLPGNIALDSRTGNLYVDQGDLSTYRGGSNAVTLISTTRNQVVASLQDPVTPQQPGPMTYVNSSGEILFVSSFGYPLGSVGALSDVSDDFGSNTPVWEDPVALTWVAAVDTVYVSNFGGGTLSLLTPGNESSPSAYSVTFNETGLPAGTNWSVAAGDAIWWATSEGVSFPEVNGTYTYSITSTSPYDVPTPSGGTFTVTGAGRTEKVTFGLPTYSVSFVEEGLPLGTAWSVILNESEESSNESEIAFQEPDGVYNFSIATLNSEYVPAPRSGAINVSNGAPLEIIHFSIKLYPVTFTESGLVSGTLWSLQEAGITRYASVSSITVNESNGTYNFTVGMVSGYLLHYDGQVTVHGETVAVPVSFTREYTVEFFELGLPAGTPWSVTLASTTGTSSGTMIAFPETNGSYAFTIASVTDFTSSDTNGTITVAGSTAAVQIVFTSTASARFEMTFSETGLSDGTNWSVTVGGTTYDSTTVSLSVLEGNGTYGYSVGSVTGYSSSPRTGTVTLSGGPREVTVAFSVTSPGGGGMGTIVPAGSWAIAAVSVVLVVLLTVLALRHRRKPGAPRSRTPPEGPPTRSAPPSPTSPTDSTPNSDRWNAPK